MSPRTKRVHLGENAAALGPVVLVVEHVKLLRSHLFASPKAHGIDERLADRIRCRRPIGHEFGEGSFGALVGSKVQNCHLDSVVRNVRHINDRRGPTRSDQHRRLGLLAAHERHVGGALRRRNPLDIAITDGDRRRIARRAGYCVGPGLVRAS